MSRLDIRPVFRIKTGTGAEEAQQRIIHELKSNNPYKFQSQMVHGHIILSMHPKVKHFWSPQMDISFREVPDDETPGIYIRCQTGPAPSVWTLLMFSNGVAGFFVLVGLMIAGTQYSLKYDLWGLWIALGGLVIAGATFAIASTGKKLAAEETRLLRQFINGIAW